MGVLPNSDEADGEISSFDSVPPSAFSLAVPDPLSADDAFSLPLELSTVGGVEASGLGSDDAEEEGGGTPAAVFPAGAVLSTTGSFFGAAATLPLEFPLESPPGFPPSLPLLPLLLPAVSPPEFPLPFPLELGGRSGLTADPVFELPLLDCFFACPGGIPAAFADSRFAAFSLALLLALALCRR